MRQQRKRYYEYKYGAYESYMKIEGDLIIFASDMVRGANNGIIGLSPDMQVFGGYDSGIWNGPDAEESQDIENRLSKQELIELADYMIWKWQEFRNLHES